MHMAGRAIIVAALAAYLGVVGCIVWPNAGSAAAPRSRDDLDDGDYAPGPTDRAGRRTGPTEPPPLRLAPMDGLPYRGVVIQVGRVDDLSGYERCIDEIAAVGADTVSIVVDVRQENGSSTQIFIDQRYTATAAQLTSLVKYAKSRKLRVLLMPIVLLHNPRGNEWRGTLKPESWDDWFASYREMIKHYAAVAQAGGVDIMVVGSELVSSESRLDQWSRTIRAVRNVFSGKVTYSANWDAYTRVPFWDQLDLVGMNSYYTLGNDNRVTVQEIVQRWRAIQRDLLAFRQRVDRPILFIEVGWCSLSNAASEPWDYTRTSLPVDLDLQRRLYEGFFQAWHGEPALGGFMVWEWPMGDGGPADRGYTPENKPAEQVLRKWLGKPWTQ
jgi:hypothetical protein